MSGGIPTYRGVVYPWHCDHVGHMNVMHYVGKFDEATWFLLNRIGLTRTFLATNGRGMAASSSTRNINRGIPAAVAASNSNSTYDRARSSRTGVP